MGLGLQGSVSRAGVGFGARKHPMGEVYNTMASLCTYLEGRTLNGKLAPVCCYEASSNELQSKLPKRDYLRDYIGEYHRGY